MHKVDISASAWRKSSHSEAGNCVEVADGNGLVLVRDNKLADGSSVISFLPQTWCEFIRVVHGSRLSRRFWPLNVNTRSRISDRKQRRKLTQVGGVSTPLEKDGERAWCRIGSARARRSV